MTFEKIHSSIRFLALFLALSEGREGRGGERATFPYDFKSDGASTALDLRGRQYQRRAIISLTNMARSPTRKRLVTLKYIGVSFFPSPRISRLALNSLRNVRTSLMRELRGDTATKNRTYHNRMRDARAIVETLRQFFHIQSTDYSITIPPYGGIVFLESPSSLLYLPTYPGDSFVIIDFTIMYRLVVNQLMHAQRSHWMYFDGRY